MLHTKVTNNVRFYGMLFSVTYVHRIWYLVSHFALDSVGVCHIFKNHLLVIFQRTSWLGFTHYEDNVVLHQSGIIGASPMRANHLYEKITIPMYTCMYVAIHHPCIHHAVCACAYRNSVKIITVYHMLLTLIVAHLERTLGVN